MGREVRMVPKDWEHPKRENGGFIALFGSDFEVCAADWDKECEDWNLGIYPSYASEDNKKLSFTEWNGGRPEKDDYMPTFETAEATQYMMYETTTEGTPISPSFSSPEELASWLVDNGASAFGSQTASYEGWLRVAKGGFSPSAILKDGGLETGVDGLTTNQS